MQTVMTSTSRRNIRRGSSGNGSDNISCSAVTTVIRCSRVLVL